MNRTRKLLALVFAGALIAGLSTVARADIVYNDLDGTIDAELEELLLVVADTDTVELAISFEDCPGPGNCAGESFEDESDPEIEYTDGHQGCNIEGGPNGLVLEIHNDDDNVSDVTGDSGGDTVEFQSCAATVDVDVEALDPGISEITFSIHSSTTTSTTAGQREWHLGPASFLVCVIAEAGDDNPCDSGLDDDCDPDEDDCDIVYDCPAAPAWAAHILKANNNPPPKGTSKKNVGEDNFVSQVAHNMGPGTDFDTALKDDPVEEVDDDRWLNTDYGEAVFDYLKDLSNGPTLDLTWAQTLEAILEGSDFACEVTFEFPPE